MVPAKRMEADFRFPDINPWFARFFRRDAPAPAAIALPLTPHAVLNPECDGILYELVRGRRACMTVRVTIAWNTLRRHLIRLPG